MNVLDRKIYPMSSQNVQSPILEEVEQVGQIAAQDFQDALREAVKQSEDGDFEACVVEALEKAAKVLRRWWEQKSGTQQDWWIELYVEGDDD